MRRDLRILLVTGVVGAAALWGPALPEALSTMETFRIEDVDVRGTRFLTTDEVVEWLALADGSSVWTDTKLLTERLVSHPMVLDAAVRRRLPDGLRVHVVERTPIALAPTPTLEPVDAEGHRLPLDPAAFRLDLPIIATNSEPPTGSRLFPEDVRVLAAEVDHLLEADTTFLQMVSSVRLENGGTLVARWTEPPVEFLLPSKAPPSRLREGLGALSNAISRTPGDVPHEIDLRFADQVVVRRGND